MFSPTAPPKLPLRSTPPVCMIIGFDGVDLMGSGRATKWWSKDSPGTEVLARGIMRWSVHLEGGPRRVNHAAVAVGHKVYSFGGYCSGEDYETLRQIDVHIFNTGRWGIFTCISVCCGFTGKNWIWNHGKNLFTITRKVKILSLKHPEVLEFYIRTALKCIWVYVKLFKIIHQL